MFWSVSQMVTSLTFLQVYPVRLVFDRNQYLIQVRSLFFFRVNLQFVLSIRMVCFTIAIVVIVGVIIRDDAQVYVHRNIGGFTDDVSYHFSLLGCFCRLNKSSPLFIILWLWRFLFSVAARRWLNRVFCSRGADHLLSPV